MPVRLLPDAVVDQIAAGEVVERPAAVVKELVENSLDAGSTRLRVHLEAGGRDLVRVLDDGHGMGRQDALMCLERHATSKIQAIEDLVHVRSFGFRGEAIPSIASVSRFELTTRPAEDEVGTLIQVAGGAVQAVRDAGCPPGTDIKVRDLFFNVPVRRSFLRTAATELGHCTEAVLRQVILRPEVDVLVLHHGRDHLRLSAVPDRVQRARDVLGSVAERLRPVRFQAHGVQVEGLVAPPSAHQSSSKGVYLYVNGRYVRDAVLRRGLREAFQGLLPAGRHPVAVIEVRVAGEEVDVNVHPSKIEVRFRNPRDVSEVLASGLREALRRPEPRQRSATTGFDKRARAPEGTLPLPGLAPHPSDDPGFVERAPATGPSWLAELVAEPSAAPSPSPTLDPKASIPSAPPAERAASAPTVTPPVAPTPSPAPSPEEGGPSVDPAAPRLADVVPQLLLAGDLACASVEGELVLIDLRAVRAALVERSLREGGAPERLLLPVVCTLGRSAAGRLVAWREPLDDIGLSLTAFGPGEVAVKRRPALLGGVSWPELLVALAEVLPASPQDLPVAALHLLARTPQVPLATLDQAVALVEQGASLPLAPPFAVCMPSRALRGLIP